MSETVVVNECRAIDPSTKNVCRRPSDRKVQFVDGDTISACAECAAYLTALAQENYTSVRVTRVTEPA